MALGYRATAAEIADTYGLAPLPVLDEDIGRRLYDQEVKQADQYRNAVILSLIDVTAPNVPTWSRRQVVQKITAERVTSIECFDDPRLNDLDEYILKIVDWSDSDLRVAFYEGAGLDMSRAYCNLFNEQFAGVSWDDERFSLGFNRVFREAALFGEGGENRAEEVRELLEESDLSPRIPSDSKVTADDGLPEDVND